MHDLVLRVLIIIWFLCYMAAIYLALHIMVARFSRAPGSRLLWFFSVVTGPLTRPVRLLLAPAASDARIRWIALATYLVLMIAARFAISSLGGKPLE